MRWNEADDTPLVLIDLSWLAYRALYSMGELSHDGRSTGVVYGVLEQLRTICHDPKVRSSKLLIFRDSKFSLRQRSYPDYKRGRSRNKNRTAEEEEQRKSFLYQVDELGESVLPLLGLPVYRQKGLESDDLIAAVASWCFHRRMPAIIITADNDLYQCISDVVSWYDPGRDKFYTWGAFTQDKGIVPSQWKHVKRIAGCQGDNVKGAPNVGVKSAIKYIRGTLPHESKRCKAITEHLKTETISPLVVLPHTDTKMVQLRLPQYSFEALETICKAYGFKSYVKGFRRTHWAMIFRGMRTMEAQQRRRKRKE